MIRAVGLSLAVLLLSSCSSAGEQAALDAEAACVMPAPEAPNFDPQQADLGLLAELAATARARADLAEKAAQADERWQALADAARALAAYADRILEVRQDGGNVTEALPAPVWDQVKLASDAFSIECRAALP
jgi:hypothetical protein